MADRPPTWIRSGLQNLGVESVFRPRERMSSFFLLQWGVQILCIFNQDQTPRSDSANLEPCEPIFCPRNSGAQDQMLPDGSWARADECCFANLTANFSNRINPGTMDRVFVENLLSELDEAEEYWVDQQGQLPLRLSLLCTRMTTCYLPHRVENGPCFVPSLLHPAALPAGTRAS